MTRGAPYTQLSFLHDLVAEGGCSCWVGRTNCGDPAEYIAVGPFISYFFYAYLERDGLLVAALCERHVHDLLADTARDITERQETAFQNKKPFAERDFAFVSCTLGVENVTIVGGWQRNCVENRQ